MKNKTKIILIIGIIILITVGSFIYFTNLETNYEISEQPSSEISITSEECTEQGGEIFNTMGHPEYSGENIGNVIGMDCPCICLI